MSSQEFINIAKCAGYDVEEYEMHYCIRQNTDIKIVITIPKVSHLTKPLVDAASKKLDL